jgi:predicted nucleic acid-binding protein
MKNVLIDTDVILDFFFNRKPFADQAAVILNLCANKQVNGYVTPVIISNSYYILRQTASHQKVIDKLKLLLSIIDILTIDKESIEKALNSKFKDFEDALQNYAAESYGKIDVIITRNIKDFKKSEIAILTPTAYLALLNQ